MAEKDDGFKRWGGHPDRPEPDFIRQLEHDAAEVDEHLVTAVDGVEEYALALDSMFPKTRLARLTEIVVAWATHINAKNPVIAYRDKKALRHLGVTPVDFATRDNKLDPPYAGY